MVLISKICLSVDELKLIYTQEYEEAVSGCGFEALRDPFKTLLTKTIYYLDVAEPISMKVNCVIYFPLNF